MEFGIGIPTSHSSWKVAQRAEELGFTHAWFYEGLSQLIIPIVPAYDSAIEDWGRIVRAF